MQIGIDASRALKAKRTGTERYSLDLINALLELESDHHFLLYLPTPPRERLFSDDAELIILPGQRVWTHTRLGPYTRRHAPDVLFVPSHVLPLTPPPHTVVTVHDLGYEYFPQAHTWRHRQYLRWSTRRHARIATQIIADSEATKQDLIKSYAGDPERIHVIHLAPDPNFQPVRDISRIHYVRTSYGIPPDAEYILHIGTIHPRKNLDMLVDAFSIIQQRMPHRKLMLVLVGGMGYEGEKLRQRVNALGLESSVRFTGYARVHDLPALYSGAACYVFPSLHEGFGFPVLEAQICEIPLICARTSSLPEVAGDGALYFDPLATEDLVSALERILLDSDLRRDMVDRGRTNVRRFSWQQTAMATLRVLEKAAGDA